MRSPGKAPPADFDAIVIGAGVNGLVCAALLAQAKRRVVVVEARDRPGGACMTGDITEGGYRVSSLAHLTGPFDAGLAKVLKLQKFGLSWSATALPTIALSPEARHIVFAGDARATSQTIAVHSPSDGQAWSGFDQRMAKTAKTLARWTRVPPGGAHPAVAKGRGGLFAGSAALPKAEALDRATAVLLDLSISDFLDQTFEAPALKGALALDAVLGSGLGPRSPGTAFTYALRRALAEGSDGFAHPEGGMGAFAAALAKAADAAGARMRFKSRVKRIMFENARTVGIELEGGEIIYAPTVVSSLDPQTTLRNLGGPRHLPFRLKRRLKGLHIGGVTAKVNLALNGLPTFRGLQRDDLRARLLVCPSVDYLDRAFAAARQGTFSPEPAMEITIPTLHDSQLAPFNEHVLSAHVLYAPYTLLNQTWEEAEDALVKSVVATLEKYAPDLSSRIQAGDFFSPPDIERISGAAGGHWHGGDLTLDRLGPLRPAAGLARYETPVPGLYLCGAGTHPLRRCHRHQRAQCRRGGAGDDGIARGRAMTIMRALNATALHARTADLCTTNAWIEDGGFTVPAAYASLREEQWMLAERAALADLSARQTWSFRGADAGSFLSFATLADAAAMAPARALETYWCDDDGFVRGKGTLIRRAASDFEMITPVRDLAWMLDGAEGFDLEIRNVTTERAAIGLAGPLAASLLAEAALLERELHAGDVVEIQWRSSRVSVLRLEGDAGFELLTPAEDAILVWDRLWRMGRSIGLGAVGADALDLARIEAGRLKPGTDWIPAQWALTEDDFRIPQDFGASPDFTRRFNGVDTLKRRSTSGRWAPVQLTAAKPLVAGALTSKSTVGRITSEAWSEARGQAVALGWLDPAVAKPGAVLTAPGPEGPVEVRIALFAAKLEPTARL